MKPKIEIETDAFSSGQISSKIWLCETLESFSYTHPVNVWILGGWYGLLGFLLLSRNRIPIRKILCIDVDLKALNAARILNENWIWKEKFETLHADANTLTYPSEENVECPNLILNTSCEHFAKMDWFERIPKGSMIGLQSNDMIHPEHVRNHKSAEDLARDYRMNQILFQGSLKFAYPNFGFERFQLVGFR